MQNIAAKRKKPGGKLDFIVRCEKGAKIQSGEGIPRG
jgi:hypothetical protein